MSNVRISEATFPTSVAIATAELLFNRLSSDYLLDLDDYPLGWVTKIFECSDSIFFFAFFSCVSISGPTSLRARLCVQISILFLQHALNHSPKRDLFWNVSVKAIQHTKNIHKISSSKTRENDQTEKSRNVCSRSFESRKHHILQDFFAASCSLSCVLFSDICFLYVSKLLQRDTIAEKPGVCVDEEKE